MTKPDTSKNSETDRGMPRSVSPYKAGFACKCPYCGESPLFKSGLVIRETCEGCGCDLTTADTGDGAQVFVILILGAISAILGFILTGAGLSPEAVVGILGVVIIGGSYLMLRIFKATLFALQIHHDAHEGSLEDES
ncbi:MAG: DUF983 domain-containing protein [Kordiimonadaceae bacterium]|nr:DUF983 domain-containing protein [Kordiimonadaceae bacterium]